MLIQLVMNGVVTAGLYAVSALGFALVYNTTRIFHIAHGAAYTFAAYICYYTLTILDWPVVAAALAGVAAAAVLGCVMEWAVFAPLEQRNASATVSLLSSLGLYTLIVNLIAMAAGNDPKVLTPGAGSVREIGLLRLTDWQVTQLAGAAAIVPVIFVLLTATGLGRSVRALRDNPVLARISGVDARRVRLVVFAVGSALAGMAAVLTALDVGIAPEAGLSVLLASSVSLVIGGVGTFAGAVLGALVLGILQSVVTWTVSARWTDAITFTVLVLFLAVRPEGLLSARRRLEEAAR